MNNVSGTGLLIPNKCQVLRYIFWNPLWHWGGGHTCKNSSYLNTFSLQKVLLTACQHVPQKNKSSLVSAVSNVHLKILTFTIQNITSDPSNVAQMNFSKTRSVSSFLMAQAHITVPGYQRCSKVIKWNQPNGPFHFIKWDQRQKYAPFLLLSFPCKWQTPGYSLVLDHMIASFLHSLPFSHLPTPQPDETGNNKFFSKPWSTTSLTLHQSHTGVWSSPTHSIKSPFHF